MIRVKVCCITSVEEADVAVRMGAAALGFVSEMPSGPRVSAATRSLLARSVAGSLGLYKLYRFCLERRATISVKGLGDWVTLWIAE
jgi:phosphoribosylanthranilate isomerase